MRFQKQREARVAAQRARQALLQVRFCDEGTQYHSLWLMPVIGVGLHTYINLILSDI